MKKKKMVDQKIKKIQQIKVIKVIIVVQIIMKKEIKFHLLKKINKIKK